MKPSQAEQEAFINQMGGYAKYLHKQGWDADKIKAALVSRGLDEANATCITDSFNRAKKERADDALTIIDVILNLFGLAGRT